VKKFSKVIAIMSSKGGSGKTVTVSNICYALSTVFGKKVLAIDTNITTASLGLHFNILEPKATLYDVLNDQCDIKDSLCKINDNLFIIPTAMKFDRKEKSLDIVSEEVNDLVHKYEIILSSLVDKFDLIVLDSAPGFNVESVSAMQIADGIIIVSNPEYPTLAATANLIKYAKILNVPSGGLILNKITGKSYDISKEEVEDVLKIKIIGEVPSEGKVLESIAARKPVVELYPHSRSAIAYKKIAGHLVGKKYELSFYESILNLFR
jgi:MinD-like ATPase involved in chromosome partitioning or flagellar assembly